MFYDTDQPINQSAFIRANPCTKTMNLESRNPAFTDLISPDAQLEQIASGFDFTEGPIWHPQTQSLIFSDIMGNSIYRWSETGGIAQLRRNSFLANGNAFTSQSQVVTCEHGTSRVTQWDPNKLDPLTNDGLEVLATHYDGKALNSPNDIVVASNGTIYFTDPGSGRSPVHGIPREREMDFCGVYKLDPTTRNLTLLTDEIVWPNGLCFLHDESQLYINDSRSFNIRRYDVQPDGTLTNGTIWGETTGEGAGVPDGMKIDSQGNIWCCAQGGIHVFDPSANYLGVIQMPEQAANLVFGDDDLNSLYITATTSVYRLRVEVAGWSVL